MAKRKSVGRTDEAKGAGGAQAESGLNGSGRVDQSRLSGPPPVATADDIDTALRAMYFSTLNEPIPQRFFDLVREIDKNAETLERISGQSERSDESS